MSIPPPASPTPWWAALPGFSVHLTTQAAIDATKPYWELDYSDGHGGIVHGTTPGAPIIVGVSPTEIAAMTGAPLSIDPAGAAFYAVPNTVVLSSQQVLPDGEVAPLGTGFGALPGGQQWAWQCSVEGYTNGGHLQPNVPIFQVKVGSYVGTSVGHNINVGFDMTGANASVQIKPKSGGDTARGGWRVTGLNGSSPVGTNTLDADAITGFTSTGFSLGINDRVNANGVTYAYVAIIDTAGTYLRVGTYKGVNGAAIQIQANNVGDTTVSCFQAAASMVGAIADFVTQQYLITGAVAGVSLTFATGWAGATGVPVNGTVLGDNRLIPIGMLPDHVWVLGGSQIYKSPEMSTTQSVSLGANGSARPLVDAIKGFTTNAAGTGFTVGTNGDVNTNNFTYAYVAFKGLPAADFVSGTQNPAAGSDTITGLQFAPGWVTTIDAVAFGNGVWRASGVQAGTDSTNWAGNPDGVLDVPAQGISSLDANGFHTGTTSMPAGHEVYWYAFPGTASISPAPTGSIAGVCPTIQGVVGMPYRSQLLATGGTPPYKFFLTFDALPPGLVLAPDGSITGVPTTAGVYSYTVQITDSTLNPAATSSVQCSITINGSEVPTPPNPAPPVGPTQVCSTTVALPSDAGRQACRVT